MIGAGIGCSAICGAPLSAFFPLRLRLFDANGVFDKAALEIGVFDKRRLISLTVKVKE